MIYLLLGILTAASLVVILKGFERFNIPVMEGIIWNYLVCAITGFLFSPDFPEIQTLIQWKGLPLSMVMGTCFITFFYLIGVSSQQLGVATTTISFKLAFILPVTSAIILYNEQITFFKILALLLCIGAVLLISVKEKSDKTSAVSPFLKWLPLLIFIGCGMNDVMFSYLQRHYHNEGWDHVMTAIIFFFAFLSGFLVQFYKKSFWNIRTIAGGIILGLPNYASLYYLLKALQHTPYQLSIFFPIYNLGIILTGVLIGILMMKEKMSQKKWAGLMMALLALGIMMQIS